MAQKAGVRKLVLTHIAPGEVDEAATAKSVGAIFKGEVLVGRDGLEVTAGGTARAPASPAGRTGHRPAGPLSSETDAQKPGEQAP